MIEIEVSIYCLYIYTHLKCSDIIGSVNQDQNYVSRCFYCRLHLGFLERGVAGAAWHRFMHFIK